jgi:ankyrin repeat protein
MNKYYITLLTIFSFSMSCLGMQTGLTPLMDAIGENNVELVRELIKYDVDVNAKNELGHTPFFRAIASGYDEIVLLLLANGADISEKDRYGNTVFHWATFTPNKKVIEFLLDAGANPNEVNNQGDTPLRIAEAKGLADEVVELFKVPQKTRSVDCQTIERYTSTLPDGFNHISWLLHAVVIDDQRLVTNVLGRGIGINEVDNNGRSALKIAVTFSNQKMIKLLIEHGATVTEEILKLANRKIRKFIQETVSKLEEKARKNRTLHGKALSLVGCIAVQKGAKPKDIPHKSHFRNLIPKKLSNAINTAFHRGKESIQGRWTMLKSGKVLFSIAVALTTGLYIYLQERRTSLTGDELVHMLTLSLQDNEINNAYELAQDNEAELAQLSGDERTKLLAAINRALGALTQAHEEAAEALPGVRQYQQWALGSEADHVKLLMNLVRIINN